MQVQLNGEPKDLAAGITVSQLVLDLGLSERRIAIEVNREIVERAAYATCRLADGDEIEVVHFVGGG